MEIFEIIEIEPNKNAVFPNEELKNICFIKNIVKASNIIIGDYTYYDDPVDGTKLVIVVNSIDHIPLSDFINISARKTA